MNHEPTSSLPLDDATRRERLQRNKATFNKKRDAFLQDLQRNIDLLIYAELSAVYYMEYATATPVILWYHADGLAVAPLHASLSEPPFNSSF